MIARLNGTVAEVLTDGAVIDVHGVGYRVFMPAPAVAALPRAGEELRVYTHLHVREDAMTLYGFETAEQRSLFDVLLSVSGIGPKGALAVLSLYSPEAFRKAVATEDLEALTLIPGVGKKTAARMVLDLREKLALPAAEGVPGGEGSGGAVAEVRSALVNLGYSAAEARKAVGKLPDDPAATVEDLLKRALKDLAG